MTSQQKAGQSEDLDLFGGQRSWSPADWTSSDDSVRGGTSYSTMTCTPFSPTATFHGNLDIRTLGGAGFASQRTVGDEQTWDLSAYDGLVLEIDQTDGKRYALVVKDEILPPGPDGREQSTVSWEYEFQVGHNNETNSETKSRVIIRWKDLKPTYRGKEKTDAQPLDLERVKRFGIMMRSFFGKQEGDFSLSIASIAAYKSTPETTTAATTTTTTTSSSTSAKKATGPSSQSEKPSASPTKSKDWACGLCIVS